MTRSAPWLVVGLGNPGRKYAHNRHNVGFMVVEAWLSRHETPGASDWRDKFSGRIATVGGDLGRVVVLEPLGYMNRSGQSVGPAAKFFQVPPERIVVVHDEIDFDFARLAVKAGGGHGGHNGLRDIVAALGSREFVRVRVGIGRPPRGNTDVSGWVLSDFGAEDAAELPAVVDRAQQAVTAVLTHGVAAAMNTFDQPPAAGGPSDRGRVEGPDGPEGPGA